MDPTTRCSDLPGAMPCSAGIRLRAPHYGEILATRPGTGWFEAHSENYFGDGGQPLYFLERVRSLYPLSLHGVGLSLGSADALDREHLRKLKSLVARFEPALVSEHLSWGAVGGRHYNDLLPLPYTEEALRIVSAHVRMCGRRRTSWAGKYWSKTFPPICGSSMPRWPKRISSSPWCRRPEAASSWTSIIFM
jgi:hypothetical protein